MVLGEPLIKKKRKLSTSDNQISIFIKSDQQTTEKQSKKQQQNIHVQKQPNRLKQFVTLVIIILTSYQVYDITTNKLDHSRNVVRMLNYHVIQHTTFGFYWVGQYALNYPIQQYFQLTQVQQFLQRFQQFTNSIDDFSYGEVDMQTFLTTQNHIYLQNKFTGDIEDYPYIVGEGFNEPFNTSILDSIKDAILRSEQIKIIFQPFKLSKEHLWNLQISITTFSETSIIVRIYAKQLFDDIWIDHAGTFILGIILLIILFKQYYERKSSWIENIPEYMLCVLLVNTFALSLQDGVDIQWLTIIDGIQCCVSWLLMLRFLQKQDDYHISFLIKQSYLLVGRLFVSFGPIFIAFSLFGYILFCREAWQFSTFQRSLLNLFYISYYNMTYESFVVTSRTNPISMIFFFIFVILFTICVYSGMLVSVFCSYVWNKRENKIKQDIINNLKIQCSSCDYKYKYIDCLKLIKQPRRSQKLKTSFILQIDFMNAEERYKYKHILQIKIDHIAKKLNSLVEEQKRMALKNEMKPLLREIKEKIFQEERKGIKEMIKRLKEDEQLNG